ncbi:Lsr2 dimerization domain-containing protein [Streptomyces chartreusis]|uniref:Lsr2 dimerization domain-containing protein n=1 Tax=Streptomyces chartreusis TaxID=1969 RepID=UPI00367B4DE5
MTGHHDSCPEKTLSEIFCACHCHNDPPVALELHTQIEKGDRVAQKEEISLGGGNVETVSFGLDGISYEIDLNLDRAFELRNSLAPFLRVARHLQGTAKSEWSTQRC